MIVVLPDSKTRHNGSMYSSSPTVGDFEQFVARDLVAYVDAHYRTLAEPHQPRPRRSFDGRLRRHADRHEARRRLRQPVHHEPVLPVAAWPRAAEQRSREDARQREGPGRRERPAVRRPRAARGRRGVGAEPAGAAVLSRPADEGRRSRRPTCWRGSPPTRRSPSSTSGSATCGAIAPSRSMSATRMASAPTPASCTTRSIATRSPTRSRSTPARTRARSPTASRITCSRSSIARCATTRPASRSRPLRRREWRVHEPLGRGRRDAPDRAAGARRGRRAWIARPVDRDPGRRQVLRLWHGQRPAGVRLRRRMDLASRRAGDAGRARRPPRSRGARQGRQQHLGPGHHPQRRPLLPLLLGPRHAAEVGDRPAGREDARSRLARLQVGGRRSGGLVRRRRGLQRDRPWRVPGSRPTALCGSPTGPTSATSAWCSSIRRPASGSIQRARRSTSRSIPRRRS